MLFVIITKLEYVYNEVLVSITAKHGYDMKTLVIFSHPTFSKSIANKVILDAYKNSNHDITIRHLEKLYSGYEIDIEAEQKSIIAADTIILQFPLYWYASPPALKNWLDQVLSFNFAYGPEGGNLKGKNLIISTTVGGESSSYHPLGYQHFKIEDLLKPFEQTAYYTNLNYLDLIYTCGWSYVANTKNPDKAIEDLAKLHVNKVFTQLEMLKSI